MHSAPFGCIVLTHQDKIGIEIAISVPVVVYLYIVLSLCSSPHVIPRAEGVDVRNCMVRVDLVKHEWREGGTPKAKSAVQKVVQDEVGGAIYPLGIDAKDKTSREKWESLLNL